MNGRSGSKGNVCSEHEHLASAQEEWEARAEGVVSNLGSASAKVDVRLASPALL